MIAKGSRVRFKQDEHDLKRRERGETALLPGPDEVFTVMAIVPWTDAHGKERYDEKAWADLGAGRRSVAIQLLEPV